MEELISLYLIKNRSCILPHIGRLTIKQHVSTFITPEHKMSGPLPFVAFEKTDHKESVTLVGFIADQKGITKDAAAIQLNAFCNSINQLFGNINIVLPCVGEFKSDAEGIVGFIQEKFAAAFMPELPAVRVIRPNAVHAVKVGDRETTSSVMTELLRPKAKRKIDLKWLWVAALALAGIAVLGFYYSNHSFNGKFSNVKKLSPAAEPSTYHR